MTQTVVTLPATQTASAACSVTDVAKAELAASLVSSPARAEDLVAETRAAMASVRVQPGRVMLWRVVLWRVVPVAALNATVAVDADLASPIAMVPDVDCNIADHACPAYTDAMALACMAVEAILMEARFRTLPTLLVCMECKVETQLQPMPILITPLGAHATSCPTVVVHHLLHPTTRGLHCAFHRSGGNRDTAF